MNVLIMMALMNAVVEVDSDSPATDDHALVTLIHTLTAEPTQSYNNYSSIPDIDECSSSSTNECDHVCTNTEGSYTCSCNSGYTLKADEHSCYCGSQLNASRGSFHSLGYPNGYPEENLECIWIIEGSVGFRIEFVVDDSQYGINGRNPCTTINEHIEFFDGTGNDATSLRKLCGRSHFYSDFDSMRHITTSSSQAKVVFTSTDRPRSASRVGVKVDYTMIGMYLCA